MSKNCILCQSTQFSPLYDLGNHKIVTCQSCGLTKTQGKMNVNYDEYHRDSDYDQFDTYFKNIFQKRYNTISQFKKQGKILDIGASTGALLQIFQENHWEAVGIEPSKSAKIAQKRGISVLQTSFEKAKLSKNSFDVVLMNHTLEHVDDPVAVLTKIYTILKKGGIVYIDVPNFGSLSSQLAGKKWKYLLPNEHVHHFTPVTLQKCIKKAGFKIMWYKTWSGIFDVASPALKFWQTLTGGKKQFFTDLIELPGNIAATSLNKGTSLAVIGKKL